MTYLHLTICSIFWVLVTTLQAQIYTPIKWTTNYEKVAVNTYDLFLVAEIDSSWVLYDKMQSPNGPTSFYAKVEKTQNVIIEEGVKHISTPIVTLDKMFEIVTRKFKNKAVFKQRITIIDPLKPTIIKFYWEYMTCNAERCLPPTEYCARFNFKTQNLQIKTIKVGKRCIMDCTINE